MRKRLKSAYLLRFPDKISPTTYRKYAFGKILSVKPRTCALLNRFLLSVALLFLVSCSSVYKFDEANYSIPEIRQAINSISGGVPRKISANQREFETRYFSAVSGESEFDPEKSRQRAYLKILVLGERRPYDIELRVMREVRVGRNYEEDGVDPRLTKIFGDEFRAKLNKSREIRNVIDDFRAF